MQQRHQERKRNIVKIPTASQRGSLPNETRFAPDLSSRVANCIGKRNSQPGHAVRHRSCPLKLDLSD